MDDEHVLNLLSTAYVEWEGNWYIVPGGWIANIKKAGLRVVSQPPGRAVPNKEDPASLTKKV